MNILVLAPHPDDEAIGCGGTIRKHVEDGDRVTVLYITSGEKEVHEEDICTKPDVCTCACRENSTAQDVREREAGVCSQILGTHELIFWREPDGEFEPTINTHVQSLVNIVARIKPDILYCPHKNETHVDHAHAFDLVETAQYTNKPMPSSMKIRYYEVWTPLTRYNVVVDIGAYVDHKRAAIRAYKSQAYNAFDEAILALNHYRGLLHGPNKMYAEVFLEV